MHKLSKIRLSIRLFVVSKESSLPERPWQTYGYQMFYFSSGPYHCIAIQVYQSFRPSFVESSTTCCMRYTCKTSVWRCANWSTKFVPAATQHYAVLEVGMVTESRRFFDSISSPNRHTFSHPSRKFLCSIQSINARLNLLLLLILVRYTSVKVTLLQAWKAACLSVTRMLFDHIHS